MHPSSFFFYYLTYKIIKRNIFVIVCFWIMSYACTSDCRISSLEGLTKLGRHSTLKQIYQFVNESETNFIVIKYWVICNKQNNNFPLNIKIVTFSSNSSSSVVKETGALRQ